MIKRNEENPLEKLLKKKKKNVLSGENSLFERISLYALSLASKGIVSSTYLTRNYVVFHSISKSRHMYKVF